MTLAWDMDLGFAQARILQLEAENDRLRKAGQDLIDDVRRRHPGEELHCPFMRELDAALKEAA